MAIWRRGRPQTLLHHSDQGSQFASEPFQRLMADHGIACSMSPSGNLWDNAAMESFFSSLKTERIRGRIYRTRDDAKAVVFDYSTSWPRKGVKSRRMGLGFALVKDEWATLPRNSLFGYHRGRIWEPYGECRLKKHSGRDVHVAAFFGCGLLSGIGVMSAVAIASILEGLHG